LHENLELPQNKEFNISNKVHLIDLNLCIEMAKQKSSINKVMKVFLLLTLVLDSFAILKNQCQTLKMSTANIPIDFSRIMGRKKSHYQINQQSHLSPIM
jgi:hypothetical protein